MKIFDPPGIGKPNTNFTRSAIVESAYGLLGPIVELRRSEVHTLNCAEGGRIKNRRVLIRESFAFHMDSQVVQLSSPTLLNGGHRALVCRFLRNALLHFLRQDVGTSLNALPFRIFSPIKIEVFENHFAKSLAIPTGAAMKLSLASLAIHAHSELDLTLQMSRSTRRY